MPEMHLRQSEFTYSACGAFTKNKEKIQKFKETTHSRYICQNELDKNCFRHNMAHKDFKDLPRRIISDKVLRDIAFGIAKHPEYDGYQRALAPMVYKVLIKSLLVLIRQVMLLHVQINLLIKVKLSQINN